MSRQGYNFGGAKAELLLKRLAAIKRDPDAGRRLFGLKLAPKACPYCGQDRARQDCIDESMAKQILPPCAVGPRCDAPEEEKRRFRNWIGDQS